LKDAMKTFEDAVKTLEDTTKHWKMP
jgi:hypothetical protein